LVFAVIRAAVAGETADPILYAHGVDLPQGAEPPSEFMYMAGGVQTITPSLDGKPVKITVRADRDTANALNVAIRAHQANGKKPYFDFNHEEREASFWPESFFWSDAPQPGIYVRGQWSGKGAAAVKGKEFRAFSPAFTTDKVITSEDSPARVKGAPLVMGGLVNDPAFKNNLPFWAKAANQNQTTMLTPEQIAQLQADLKKLQDENATLKAKEATAENTKAIQAKDAEITTLQGKLSQAETALKAKNKETADLAIRAAVARGVFPAQAAEDSEEGKIMARWRSLIEADPSYADLLAKQSGNTAVGATITAGASRIQVGPEDIKRVVKAYGDIKATSRENAQARAVIYARDIAPRLEKEWTGIVQAANSLGGVVGDLVVQRSLDLLTYELPVLSRISTDFSGETAAYGQTIKTRLRAVPAVGEYDNDNGYPTQDINATDVDVVINKHKSVQHRLTVNDLASTKRLLFPEQEEGMLYALGADMVASMLALITAANFPNATKAQVDTFARKHVIAMKTKLNKRKVTGGTRTLLLNSDFHGSLEEDTTVVSALINRSAGDAIASSMLPPIARFQPVEAPYLPDNGEKLAGAGFRADALAMACRLPADYTQVFPGATGGGVVSTVTSANGQLSVMLVQFIDHKLGAALMRVAHMYGVAKGNADALERLEDKA
jgi:phage I-like protein